MQNETVSTPPSQGGVFCSPPLARAHVDCRNYRRQTGYKYISCSQTTGAGAHAREAIADRAAYFKAWRAAKWGGDFDPVAVAALVVGGVVTGLSGCYVGKASFQGEDMRMYPFFGTAVAPAGEPAD